MIDLIENTHNLNSKLNISTYEITNQSVLDQINLRQGVFTPKPSLYFKLNIEGETPIMNLALSENEVATLTNFHNKTDTTTLLNTSLALYDTVSSVNSKITTVNDSINLRVSETTLNSTLWNYLGFNLSRSTALGKSIDVSDYDYLKFEGSGPILTIDRTNFYGYTTNTVITSNLGTNNIWCYKNLYLATNTLFYTDTPETQYINTTELSYLKNASSNIQTQINNKVDSISLTNYDTSTTVTSKINALSTNFNSNNISCNTNLYLNQAAIIYTNNSRTQNVTPFDIYIYIVVMGPVVIYKIR